jgi:hypothetical protein
MLCSEEELNLPQIMKSKEKGIIDLKNEDFVIGEIFSLIYR